MTDQPTTQREPKPMTNFSIFHKISWFEENDTPYTAGQHALENKLVHVNDGECHHHCFEIPVTASNADFEDWCEHVRFKDECDLPAYSVKFINRTKVVENQEE